VRRIRISFPNRLKRFTNPVIGPIAVWIVSGVNRGRRWSLASWGSGYGSGRREGLQMAMFRDLIHEGDVVWDVGAHYGFVTLLAAQRVGPGGHVHAFEPSSASRVFLNRHVRWNHLTNVTVQFEAVGGNDGSTSFGGGSTSKQHRLGGGGEDVQVRTVGTLLKSCRAPSFLKIDVEGAEGGLLTAGCGSLPRTSRLVVAVHSPDVYEECVQALGASGFRLWESRRLQRYRGAAGAWGGDADLIAFGPDYEGYEEDVRALAASGV